VACTSSTTPKSDLQTTTEVGGEQVAGNSITYAQYLVDTLTLRQLPSADA